MFGFGTKKKTITIYAPTKCRVVKLEDVNDEVFSSRMIGDGVGIIPEEKEFFSPANGEVISTFPTGHAYGFKVKDSELELLMHIGIDTVDLKKKSFISKVKEGDVVKTSSHIATANLKNIEEEGKETTTLLIFTKTSLPAKYKLEIIADDSKPFVNTGEELFKIVY